MTKLLKKTNFKGEKNKTKLRNLKNPNCEKTKKTHIVTKLKNSNGDKTQILKSKKKN